MTPFVLATDGSDFSLKAARYLHDNAILPEDAVVHVLHVAPTLTGRSALLLDTKAVTDWQKAEAAEAIEPVLEVLHQLGIVAESKSLTGNAASEIAKYADEIGARMIVLGAHGRGALTDAVLGSVTNRVLHRANCAVLVVK